MADITFLCPECSGKLVVDEGGRGLTVDCPRCGKRISVPNPGGDIGIEEPVCPSCGTSLAKKPARKMKCAACGDFIYVRTRASDRHRVLVTATEAQSIDQAWHEIEPKDALDDPILRTYVFQAYAIENWAILKRQVDVFPYWEYLTVGDNLVRPEHAALDRKIIPANSTFWETHFPPWNWGCRCQAVGRTKVDADAIRCEDAGKPPEERRILEGELLRRAESGQVFAAVSVNCVAIRKFWDVTPPFQTGQPDAYRWKPGTLQIPWKELRTRYASRPALWEKFVADIKSATCQESAVSS